MHVYIEGFCDLALYLYYQLFKQLWENNFKYFIVNLCFHLGCEPGNLSHLQQIYNYCLYGLPDSS